MRTILLDSRTNIALIRSHPSFSKFHSFCNEIASADGLLGEQEPLETPPIVTDNEDSMSDDEATLSNPIEQREHPDLPGNVFDPTTPAEGSPRFELLPEDEEVQYKTAQAEFLAVHYRLGHMPPEKIRALAKRGDLPKRLLNCRIPRCLACLYGKATRRPWRTKAPVNSMKTPPVNAPGAVVAIDHLISSVPLTTSVDSPLSTTSCQLELSTPLRQRRLLRDLQRRTTELPSPITTQTMGYLLPGNS
jgi:hypothetical protein